tara:strand:+ start:149 stop:1081 length:933 start_codon:yes stop_codon:yes gene_type:complete
MNDSLSNQNYEYSSDEIDLWELINVIFKGKWIIVSITIIASIFVVLYSLSLPNIYQSNAILVPVESSDSISSNGSYSALASLAGINLPTQSSESNSVKALEKLNTLSFFENNVLPNIFLPDLMALESYDFELNLLSYNQDIYDIENNAWIRDFSPPQKQIPTSQESFLVFKDHMTITENKKTGFVTLVIKHQSPFIAKKWAEILIDQINSYYREKDKMEAEKAVTYLNNQIIRTSFTEIKQVIAGLLQQETQKLTLIEANESYVFDYIDPPAAMERKSSPIRSLICIIGAFVGGMIGLLIVLIRHYVFRE